MIQGTAGDGHTLSIYRAEPAGTPRGAVVVAQEIFGVNGHIRAVCDDFAREGYAAVAPALFDRVERGVELGYGGDDVARGRALLSQPVPMLGGKSPRQAARSKAGRLKVTEWLKYLENQTAHRAGAGGVPAYDFGWIWEELKIADLRR